MKPLGTHAKNLKGTAGRTVLGGRRFSASAIKKLTRAERKELLRGLAGHNGSTARADDLLGRFLLAEVVNGALTSPSLDEALRRLVELASASVEAERGTIFLLDRARNELFSRIMQGNEVTEIRIPRATGIAGAVFNSGYSEIVVDCYADTRFNPTVDQHIGFHTRSLVCVPLRMHDGSIIGVFELLNKRSGEFGDADLALLEAIARQAAAALELAKTFEDERRERSRDLRLLDAMEVVTAELEVDRLLAKIVEASATLLDGERASLFIHDRATGELFSRVTAGGHVDEMRFRTDVGIAGATFSTGETINVNDAYADLRFNPTIDQRTGFTTRSLISAPVLDQAGRPIAVLQVLNSRSGQFTTSDDRRLRAFASQAAIALMNAQLFAGVQGLKAYSEDVIRSLSEGIIKLDSSLAIVSLNAAARKILAMDTVGMPTALADELWGALNPWLLQSFAYVSDSGDTDYLPDVDFVLPNGTVASVNVTMTPLQDPAGALMGFTVILHDIEPQKKVQATINRYMAKEFADRVFSEDAAHSQTVSATMLFSDIRQFTTIAKSLTPQGTVEMLNEYFSEMGEIVQMHRGILDKYIGDAIMAVFGAVVASPQDADNAVAAAVEMIRRLRELNQRRQSRGAQPLEIGIGLASGEIVAGPIGSSSRMSYTVIGDSVNLASRLEGANKYGTSVLVAGPTVERLKASVRLRRIDLIRAKGKEVPTEIFELLDHHPAQVGAKYDEIVKPFEEGIRRYRARQWSRALDRFAAVLKVIPNDGPSWVYTDRCLYYRDHPPPDHWDGVWTWKSK